MSEKIKLLWNKIWNNIIKTEAFKYAVVGGLTTVINWACFGIFDQLLLNVSLFSIKGWYFAEALAFLIAVIFAFLCDKFIVFKNGYKGIKNLLKEFWQFISMRLISEIVNIVFMSILISKLNFNKMLSKILVSVIVIILNYIFSKFFIFKK